eukprot:m.135048 g.135048  ORF g.135048 m.135048 type:complete len:272 (-) comp9880_c1_seq8:428-1243(-)
MATSQQWERAKPITPSSTIGSVFSYSGPPEEMSRSTSSLDFSASYPPRRRSARPTSKTRHNNPHASKSFQTRQLPNGEFIHVSAHGTDTNWTRPEGVSEPTGKQPALSSTRSTYVKHDPEGWQRGNTSRYGLRDKPWANSASPSVGIVPVVTRDGLGEMSSTLPTTREAYNHSPLFTRFQPSGTRRSPTKLVSEDADTIRSVVRDECSDVVEDWIRTAPSFEGEVIKRMLRETSAKTRSNLASRSGVDPGQAERVRTPQYDYISDWSGPTA